MNHSHDNPSGFESEYGRILLACQIAGTLTVLLAGASCARQYHLLLNSFEIFENMVEGGLEAMPLLTKTALRYQSFFGAGASLGLLISLAFVWLAGKRIPRVIYATAFGAAFALLAGEFFQISHSGPLLQVMTRLHG
jgi:hypothetical protein